MGFFFNMVLIFVKYKEITLDSPKKKKKALFIELMSIFEFDRDLCLRFWFRKNRRKFYDVGL